MNNNKSRQCIHDGCKTRPVFNVEGSKIALYCAVHKKDGMNNIKSKRCIHDGCKTLPVFNVEGSKEALYCVCIKKMEW